MDEKLSFLEFDFVPLLRKLQPGQKGNWGKMDAQQMVEHFRDVLQLGNGNLVLPPVNTDPEKLAKMQEFLRTDIAFRENTKSALLPEDPLPYKFASLSEAIDKLEPELDQVLMVYRAEPDLKIVNPIFGALDFAHQVDFLYKHALHHLKQFGLI